MEQLKFKVWDFEGNDGKGWWIEESTGFTSWGIDADGCLVLFKEFKYTCDIRIDYTPGRFDILTWTGQKDGNGEDIYDGHIVGLSYGIPVTRDILVIEYADNENIADISVSGWWMRNTRPNGVSSSLCKTYEHSLEILGHKYTNPELVPGKEGE